MNPVSQTLEINAIKKDRQAGEILRKIQFHLVLFFFLPNCIFILLSEFCIHSEMMT